MEDYKYNKHLPDNLDATGNRQPEIKGFMASYILTPVFAIYAVVSAYKRRPGAVILLRVYLAFILFLKVAVLIMTGVDSDTVSTISGIVWNVVFLIYICFSETVDEVFPEENRSLTRMNIAAISCFVLIPIITFAIGFLGLIF